MSTISSTSSLNTPAARADSSQPSTSQSSFHRDIAAQVEATVQPVLAAQFDAEMPAGSLGEGREVVMINKEVDLPQSKAYVFNTVGLTGGSRRQDVEKKDLQTKLDRKFNEIRVLLGEKGEIDLFFGLGENNEPVIHTISLYERNADGSTETKHYDLLMDGELQKLLTKNNVTRDLDEIKGKLKILAEEFDEILNKISPRSNNRSKWSSEHIGDLNGFNLMHTQSQYLRNVLFDQNFMENSVAKLMAKKESGLVDNNGMLNEHGERALKEIAMASALISHEDDALTKVLKALQKEKQDILDKGSDSLANDHALEAVKKQINMVEKELNELRQTSQFSVAWMIMELNRPDGNGQIVADKLINADGEYRGKKAADAAKRFNQHVRERTAPSGLTFPWNKGMKKLSSGDTQGGVEHGALFYYGAKDFSPRISNLLFHERQNASVARDMLGVKRIVEDAQEIVESRNPVHLNNIRSQLSDQDQNQIDSILKALIERLEELDTKMKNENAKAWTEMTPQVAVEFLRDNRFAYDNRWATTKMMSRNHWKKPKTLPEV